MFSDHFNNFPELRYQQSERNNKLVLSEILLRGPLSRTEIAQRVGITQASVSRITRNFLDSGLIEETGQYGDETKPGRRSIGVQIKANGAYVAGVAINAFQQDVVISNLGNNTIAARRLQFSNLENADPVLGACSQTLNQLILESGIDRNLLIGCGVTISGAIDPVQGRLNHATTLGWQDLEVRQVFESNLKIPVVVENIPNSKNLAARYFGPAKHINNVILFNCSLAIGASLLIDGNILRGAKSEVGLIDSLLIPDPEESGRYRPLDQLAGGFGILGESMLNTSVKCFKMAKRLTRVIELDATELGKTNRSLEQAGSSMANAIMCANAFLHPQKILLSGPLIENSVYRRALVEAATQMIGSTFVNQSLKPYLISSVEAARSLAIHHFLLGSGFARIFSSNSERYAT